VVMTDGLIVEPWDLGLAERPVNVEESLEMMDASANNDLQQVSGAMNISGMTIKEARSLVEQELLLTTIKKHDGNIVATAKALGVSRPTLYDLMKKHGMH